MRNPNPGVGARCMFVAVAVAIGGACAAAEPPPPPEGDVQLPDVVITATRTEKSAFDIPASINAVSIGTATDTLGVNPSEFLDGIPGLLARDRQNYAQDEQISI